MAEINPPSYESGQCYTAQQDRALWDSIICSEGVCDKAAGDLAVTAAGVFNTSVAAGCAWIQGDTVEDQGVYYVENDAPVTLTHAASDPVDDRIDLVVARVYDSEYSGTLNEWRLEILQGVPSPAPVAPSQDSVDNAIGLAQVRVRGGSTEILASDITDVRVQYKTCAASEPEQGLVDIVTFTASSSFTKATYPDLRAVWVQVVGGGGGGGSASSTGAGIGSAGGGGGGGGFSERFLTAAELSAVTTVAVGGGGAGSVQGTGNPGGTGGQSSFGGLCTAGGGIGGIYGVTPGTLDNTAQGGAGGTPFSGDFGMPGQTGDNGRTINGRNIPARGGDAGNGMGTGGTFSNANTGGSGLTGVIYGGGGGGAFSRDGGAPGNGGAGAAGVVIIYIYQ